MIERRFLIYLSPALDLLVVHLQHVLVRAQLHDRLAEEHRKRGDLLRHLFAAEEEERRRLAREFHDEPAQVLNALLVLDLSMPDLGGLDVLAQLHRVSPTTQVAVVSQHADQAYVMRALRLGARAFVPKKALSGELVTALRAVLRGQTYVHPSVADLVVEAAIHPEVSDASEDLARLTPRELEVLRLTAEGRIAKEIAGVLDILTHTVNRHRANLMEKLNLHSVVDLVKFAVRNRVIEVDEES